LGSNDRRCSVGAAGFRLARAAPGSRAAARVESVSTAHLISSGRTNYDRAIHSTDESRQVPAGPQVIYGRERELATLNSILARGSDQGEAVVISGAAGIGKSAVLKAVARNAASRETRILSATGVQSEAHLPFAGLHQLLRPVLGGLQDLPAGQRGALGSAFGLSAGGAPDLFLIALGTLTLLSDAAAQHPLVLIAEDAHWFDRETAEVLMFVGRRLGSDPIVLLAAIRSGFETPFQNAGFRAFELERLNPAKARGLLTDRFPDLAPRVAERLLAAADGNPLGLIALPSALTREQLVGEAELPEELPLTEQLERAFAAQATELPTDTQTLLLVAAVNDGDGLSESLRAAGVMLGRPLARDVLSPAISVRLLDDDQTRLRFRHPLVRSAIRQAAGDSRRRAAHAALAQALAGDPDRQIWHRAAASMEPDEDVATALELGADRALQRGSSASAIAALERAGELSQDTARKAGRLLSAAELALNVGRIDIVSRLVRTAESLALGPIDQGRLVWLREATARVIRGEPTMVLALIEMAERMAACDDDDLALKLLLLSALHALWVDRGDVTNSRLLGVCNALPVDERDPRVLAIAAHADPIDQADRVIRLATSWQPSAAADWNAMYLLSLALAAVGAFVLGEEYATVAAERLRREGRLQPLVVVLQLRAQAEILCGRWGLALADLEESNRIADETGQSIWKAAGQALVAWLAGVRGDDETAGRLAAEAEEKGFFLGTSSIFVFVQIARGMSELSAGRHAAAYDELRRMFDPADPAHHSYFSSWSIANLAEAALLSGNLKEARVSLETVEQLGARSASPMLHVGMRYARAVLAEPADAEELYRAGLSADLTQLPFDRARLQFAYGAWLRRQRRPADSRAPLRAARDTFDALGAAPWSDRARQELRASGERSRRRESDARDQLSPQELQIAQMAADGQSNREIGQRLFLSHRTVGSHLYRIFPKLGIASRAELPRALAAPGSPSHPS
jgi:DNA-binding CsgD family transcriptional regulator